MEGADLLTNSDDDDDHEGMGSDGSQEDLQDEVIPLDANNILLDPGDTEILLDENSEDETSSELTDEEPDTVGNWDLSTVEYRRLPSSLEAGCVWDADDYSCAFDAVFMTFYSLYGQSDQTWRDTWKGESPQWNAPLGNLFDLLLSITTSSYPPQEHSLWFSRCRDIFRDQVTESNLAIFRRGRYFAPVSDILQRILGGTNAEPLAHQNLICPGCGTEKRDARLSLSYLCFPFNLNPLRRNQDPDVLPLQLVLARYFQRYSMEPGLPYQHCHICRTIPQVHSLHFSETSWTWFELREGEQFVLPSLKIHYSLLDVHQTYTLQAVIYLGAGHFTTRMRKGPNTWWNYDGMRQFGKPQLEVITTEEGLIQCDDRNAAFLIYCRDNGNN